MSAFTLDTSGEVGDPEGWGVLEWSDLDAFTQGYIEALAAAPLTLSHRVARSFPNAAPQRLTHFSDLAPETLARIMEDCEKRLAENCWPDENTAQDGRDYWESRQRGFLIPAWRPLTAYLGDDGKVHLREVGQ